MTEAHLKQSTLLLRNSPPLPSVSAVNKAKLCKKKKPTKTNGYKETGQCNVRKTVQELNTVPSESVISGEICWVSQPPINDFGRISSNIQNKQVLLLQTMYDLSEGRVIVSGIDVVNNFQPVLKLISEEQTVSFDVKSWKQLLSCKDLIIQYFMSCEDWVIESIGFPSHNIRFFTTDNCKLLIISDRLQNVSVTLSYNVAFLLMKIDFVLTYLLESLCDLKFSEYIKCYSTNLKEYESKLFSELNLKQINHSCAQAACELYLFFWEHYIKNL